MRYEYVRIGYRVFFFSFFFPNLRSVSIFLRILALKFQLRGQFFSFFDRRFSSLPSIFPKQFLHVHPLRASEPPRSPPTIQCCSSLSFCFFFDFSTRVLSIHPNHPWAQHLLLILTSDPHITNQHQTKFKITKTEKQIFSAANPSLPSPLYGHCTPGTEVQKSSSLRRKLVPWM